MKNLMCIQNNCVPSGQEKYFYPSRVCFLNFSEFWKKNYSEYPFIYTVFKQWFGLFVLELPGSQENSLILDDLPTVRRQHEKETAVVQCEEMGNQRTRLRNKMERVGITREEGVKTQARNKDIISFMGTSASCWPGRVYPRNPCVEDKEKSPEPKSEQHCKAPSQL